MKRMLTILAVLLIIGPAAAQSAGAAAQAEALFYASAPEQGAELVAETTVAAAAQVDLNEARYVVLKTAEDSYTFALDTKARAQGQVQLAVDGTAQTLSEAAVRIQAAAEAGTDLAIFTEGEPDEGIVIGIYPLSDTNAAVDVAGATHVRLFHDGDSRTLRVEASGDTLAEVTVAGGAEPGAETEGLIEAATSLGSGVDASFGTDMGANIGADLGVGIDSDPGEGSASGEASGDLGIDLELGGN